MPLEHRVASFERGFTDNYVNGPRNAGQRFDNLQITRNRKPQSRPGSEIFDDTSIATQQIPPGAQRIQYIKSHEGVVFEFTGGQVFYRDGALFPQLQGPVDAHNFFGGVGTPNASHNSSDKWQAQLIATIDTYSRPRKIYADETGTQQVRTVGLPSPGDIRKLTTSFALANALKITYNAHVNDTSPIAANHNSTDTNVTAANATDVDTLITLVNQIKDLYILHNADAELGSPVTHVGQAVQANFNDRMLDTRSDATSLFTAIELLNDLKSKYNAHDLDAVAHDSGGANHPESTVDATGDPTLTSETPGAISYIYGFNYKYTYKTNGKTYIVRGPIQETVITNGNDFSTDARGIDISDIPELLNTSFGTFEAWDTDAIVVEINRTQGDGIILKRVGEVANGTTTFEDDTLDADLGINAYTAGGAVNNDPAPLCKYVTQADDVFWYANVKEDSEEHPYRVRQAIQNAPDSAPAGFFTDLDGEITGISAVRKTPIVFTKDKTYRLEGIVDAQGRGVTRKTVVDSTVGCVSDQGIVPVKDGIYFPAVDGFYFTNGLKTTKVSNHLIDSYRNIASNDTNAKRIDGAHDPINERIFWAVTSDPTSVENDQIWKLDPHWGFPNGQGSFQTDSFGANGKPTAVEVVDGELLRADSRGYLFRHDAELFTDPVIDTGNNPEDWETTAVIWDYISSAFSFGSEFRRKLVTFLLTVLKSVTNVSVLPQSINDDTGATRDLKEIRLRNLFEWGDPFFEWQDPTFVWNAPATDSAPRRFPKRGLRCKFKQIRYTNSFTIKSNSDQFGAVVVDATLNTVTIASGVFSSDLVNFQIFFGTSTIGHLITAATTTELTVLDPSGLLNDGTEIVWVIKGFRKGEQFNLEAYTIIYDFFGVSNTAYNVGDDGGNA